MGSNSLQKIRIVGKIRPLSNSESQSMNRVSTPSWISVHKPSEEFSDSVTVSFGDQESSRKETYELDYCYEQNEDNGQIFTREIKSLLLRVFDGSNASVIAYGARASGKTYTIQGTEEKPGLATLTMAEILSVAEESGKQITISFYEIYQEHVYDLLVPERPEISVLEDARGKIQLKGLSQVAVKSISEFHRLYFNSYSSSSGKVASSSKAGQKMAVEQPRRSHKGLIVNVSSCHGNSDPPHIIGKINFVDLAGYEDSRRKGSEVNILESTKINKSLYALQNVLYALNTKESRVPYRESKLTRLLQDSLGGINQTLMITCLNPLFCQDTISAVSLASRSCQAIIRVFTNSTRKAKTSTKSTTTPSRNGRSATPLRNGRLATVSTTMKKVTPSRNGRSETSSLRNGRSGTVSTTMKKVTSNRLRFSENKVSGTSLTTSLVVKGRKLFDEGNCISKFDQEKPTTDVSSKALPLEDNVSTSASEAEEKTSTLAASIELEPSISDKVSSYTDRYHDVTLSICGSTEGLGFVEEGHDTEKENKISLWNENGSPPISARLRELSNTLKALSSSTPCIKLPSETNTEYNDEVNNGFLEAKTPVLEPNLRVNDKWETANTCTPMERFSARSSGMKKSLINEFLKFLNTATKEELIKLKGIKEKRATYILELRDESPEPFKDLDDLKAIGVTAKEIRGMMMNIAGDLF